MAKCARKTISVRADLKARMDVIDEHVNWSAVACEAFERMMAEIAKQKGARAMKSTIERLRESKKKSDESRFQEGFEAGQRWAKESAEADQLERLSDFRETSSTESWGWEGNFNLSDQPFTAAQRIAFVILGEECNEDCDAASNFWLASCSQRDGLPDEFVRGFAEGALDVWDTVKDEI